MTRFRVNPGDVPPEKAARRLGLSLADFEARKATLPCRGLREPEPTTGAYDLGFRTCTPPLWLAPRGLSRVQAAAYIGVSPTLFDQMVKDGRMPRPKLINSRRVWDRLALDEAFAALPDTDDAGRNEWDTAPQNAAE